MGDGQWRSSATVVETIEGNFKFRSVTKEREIRDLLRLGTDLVQIPSIPSNLVPKYLPIILSTSNTCPSVMRRHIVP